jgi:hypothetical protein
MLKEVDKFKRVFISPDMTRKQQERDRELRRQLKSIQEAETDAQINNGNVNKNVTGGTEEILFQIQGY